MNSPIHSFNSHLNTSVLQIGGMSSLEELTRLILSPGEQVFQKKLLSFKRKLVFQTMIHPPPCNYLPRRLPNMNYIERVPCTLLPIGFFQQILAGNEEWWGGRQWVHPHEVTFRPNGITTQLQLVLSIPNISSFVDHPYEINCPWWMGVPSTFCYDPGWYIKIKWKC